MRASTVYLYFMIINSIAVLKYPAPRASSSSTQWPLVSFFLSEVTTKSSAQNNGQQVAGHDDQPNIF